MGAKYNCQGGAKNLNLWQGFKGFVKCYLLPAFDVLVAFCSADGFISNILAENPAVTGEKILPQQFLRLTLSLRVQQLFEYRGTRVIRSRVQYYDYEEICQFKSKGIVLIHFPSIFQHRTFSASQHVSTVVICFPKRRPLF